MKNIVSILFLSAFVFFSCGGEKKEGDKTEAVCKCEHACKTKADCEKNCGPECDKGE